MRATRWIAAAAVLGASAALAVPSSASAAGPASTSCVAYGAMPTHVAMRRDHVVVHAVLRGSAGCHNQMSDDGATATLHRPGQPDEMLRWRKFGGSQAIGLHINLDRTGRYTLTSGAVSVYDSKYRKVPYTWRTTVLTVTHAGRITQVTAGGSAITGHAAHYTKFGWRNSAGVPVVVQRRAVGSSTWHRLGSTHADSSGRVYFAAATSSGSVYRLVTRATPSVSRAESKGVRG